MNRFFTLLLAASCLTTVGQVDDSFGASSNWQWLLEFNGHEYWVLSEPLEWEPARDLCDSLGAYLYWPNDEAEHQAVWDLLPHGNDGVQFWTAIHQDFSVVECGTLNGGWVGPTGEIQTFLPWYPNEPNNGSAGRESVVQFEWDGIGSLFNDAPGQNECDQGSSCECRFAHVILEREAPSYCADPSACNYGSAPAIVAECDYTCCPGPGCCGAGTNWNWQTSECDVTNPSDSNFDGCVQLNDLLDLLSAYGDCGAEESPWQCGDPLEYQGYDYETVQIGEQCWFAENLRAENYRNGEEVPNVLDWNFWLNDTIGATALYGEGDQACYSNATNGDACDDEFALSQYGRLYNWFAISNPMEICPAGWHVPYDMEWVSLEVELGMELFEANSVGLRGLDEGEQLKSIYGWKADGGGTNSSGFGAWPGGYRIESTANFVLAGISGWWWTATESDDQAWYRQLLYDLSTVDRNVKDKAVGMSVRCIKD